MAAAIRDHGRAAVTHDSCLALRGAGGDLNLEEPEAAIKEDVEI